MTPKILALAAMAALMSPAVLAQTQTQSDAAAPPSQDAMQAAMTTAPGFAQRAASSNMFEIQSSELALQMSQNQRVQEFAQQMITDHTAAGERMKVAAQSDGLATADMMMADHQAQLQNLADAGEDFDQAYLSAQLAAHEEAVMLFQGYAQGGEDGALRTFAAETLPTLQAHRDEVARLSGQ